MGINMRTTMDIDVNITGMNFEKDTLVEIFQLI
jgi:oligoribonuclease (3'-5' exoribonuclease)